MRLTGSTSTQAIRERFGVGDAETLRESERRRRYLQKYARLLTTDRPTVRLSADVWTATTTNDGEKPEITVTTRPLDQPTTDLRRRVFDLAVQEALVVHEIGHIRYTDIDRFHDLLARADADRRRLFARVWNTLEDGAIERQLRHRYAVSTELDVLNANLLQTETLSRETSDDTDRLSFVHAVICGLADMAIYDSGRFRRLRTDDVTTLQMASVRERRLLDEFVPAMRETVEQVLAEPDPVARTEDIWSLWTALRDRLDDRTPPDANAGRLARLLDADGTVRLGDDGNPRAGERTADADLLPETGAGAPLSGKPDDTAGAFGRTTQPASELGRDKVTQEVTRQVESATRDTDGAFGSASKDDSDRHAEATAQDRQTAPAGSRVSDDEWVNGQSHPGAGGLSGQPESDEANSAGSTSEPGEQSVSGRDADQTAEIRDQYAAELATEAAELDDAEARLAELEAYVQALDETDRKGVSLRVVTEADAAGAVQDRWQTVSRDATRLARRFKSRLREQQRDVERSHRRRGAFDRSRLVAASRGQPDVFVQTEEGEDKQYSCIVVLDRSASMGDGTVSAAERGALTAATALESIGVAVTLFDLYSSSVRLVKTRVEETQTVRERVLTEQTGGGTPLTTALSVVQARFRDAENPFVVVVTDGQPDNPAAYTAELEAVTVPVLGVYLRPPDESDGRPVDADQSHFHALTVVEEWSSLTRQLEQLARQILF